MTSVTLFNNELLFTHSYLYQIMIYHTFHCTLGDTSESLSKNFRKLDELKNEILDEVTSLGTQKYYIAY